MRRVGKIKNGKSVQHEFAVVNAGIAAYIDHDLVRRELPVGTRKFTGGNCAVIDHVVVGPVLFHNLSREGEGRGRSQYRAPADKTKAGGRGNVIEASRFRCEVVVSVASSDVVVIRAAFQAEVSRGGSFAAVGIVSNFIRSQDIIPVVNLSVAVQFVDVAGFFLLVGANRRRVRVLVCGLHRTRRCGDCALRFLHTCRGRSRVFLRIRRKQPAGY